MDTFAPTQLPPTLLAKPLLCYPSVLGLPREATAEATDEASRNEC